MKMRIILVVISFLFVAPTLMAQEDSLYRYPFPKSWKEAKKISKKTRKPILLHRTIQGVESDILIEREIFGNKELMDSLSQQFVIYKAQNGIVRTEDLNDLFYCRYSPVFNITDHKERSIYQFYEYSGFAAYLSHLKNYKNHKPIHQYYKEYPDSMRSSLFIKRFTKELFKQGISDERIFYDYLEVNKTADEVNFEILTSEFFSEEDDLLFQELYFDFRAAGYSEQRLQRRLIESMFGENKYTFVRSPDGFKRIRAERNRLKEKVFDDVKEFLGETTTFRDSMLSSFEYINAKTVLLRDPSENNIRNLFKKSLALYYYDIIAAFGENKVFEMTFDLCLAINGEEEMNELIYVIKKNETLKDQYQYVEILALCYYRLDDENETVKLLAKANELAVAKGIKFRPVLSKLRADGNIRKIEKTPRKN